MFTPKDIVVYLDSTEPQDCRPQIDYAVGLASSWEAKVIIAFAPEDLSNSPHNSFARGAALRHMLNDFEDRKRKAEEQLREMLSAIAAQTGVECELRICSGETGEALMLHARHAAMAIIGAQSASGQEGTNLTAAVDVIFASGRPTILVPRGQENPHPLPRTVVIGWNASREAARAIADAMPFLTAADSVHVVVVPEPKINRLLGEDPGTDISRHLARHGIAVELHRLDASDAGEALLAKAAELEADMIVVGAYGQPRITEFVFGSATSTLLSDPDRLVFLSR